MRHCRRERALVIIPEAVATDMRLAVAMLAAAWTRHITATAARAPLGAGGWKMEGPGDVFAAEEQLQWLSLIHI